MRRALVTGGAGFIGSNVVKKLLDAGWAVRVLCLPGEKLTNLEGLDVEPMEGDVTDRASVRRAVAGCDRVFHLAAVFALWSKRPERMREVNVEGTRTVLREAGEAGVARVVHTSSIAVFGGQGAGHDATEESPFRLGPTGDLYSRTKYEAHLVAEAFAARGLDVVIVAPTGPLGPGDVGPTPTGRLMLSAAVLPAVVVVDSGTNFIDVRDLAEGHLLAAEKGRRGESYLLGAENLELSELARLATRALGVRRPIIKLPHAIAERGAHALVQVAELTGRPPLVTPAAVRIARLGLTARCDKAVRELGLRPRPVRASVADAIAWFAEHGYIRSRELSRRALASRGAASVQDAS